jgi:hypothetical protein
MTRMLLIGMAAVSLAGNVFAAEADGFAHWTVKDIQETEKALAASGKDPASQGLGSFGNRAFALAHRKSDGKAEIHERKHDIFFVQAGEATLVTGGTIVDDRRETVASTWARPSRTARRLCCVRATWSPSPQGCRTSSSSRRGRPSRTSW